MLEYTTSINMYAMPLHSKRITSFINLEKLWLKNNFHLDGKKMCHLEYKKKKWQQSHKQPYALVYKDMLINSYFEYIMTTVEQNMYRTGIKFLQTNKKQLRVEVIFKFNSTRFKLQLLQWFTALCVVSWLPRFLVWSHKFTFHH